MRTRQWIAERRREELKGHAEITDDTRYLRKAWTIRHGALSVTGWRSEFGGDHRHFKRRHVVFIVSEGDRAVARATFAEWKSTDWLVEWDDFLIAADESSSIDAECADVLSRYWDDEHEWPFEYGNVVIFDRLSIPKPHPDIWPTIDTAIKRQFMRSASLMVLKAFPLEWEGHGETDNDTVFHRRLEAMKRLYARQLGVTSFQGEANKNWMWKALRHCPEPLEEPIPQPGCLPDEYPRHMRSP